VTLEDPVAMASRADNYFINQQFEEAAELYQRMLVMGSGGVDTYNNLGITLHYLGRSDEALSVLDEGVEVDATYQRIWLTMGYVNSQIGHTEKARTALATAVSLDAASDVGQSAAKMLENLP
jgi:tetratricopeptide (TPR) repeat protein